MIIISESTNKVIPFHHVLYLLFQSNAMKIPIRVEDLGSIL